MSDYDPNFKSTKHFSIVGQKIVISNSREKILILKRSEKSGSGGKWSLPGGALDENETSEKGIQREVEEEVQITINYPRPFYIKTYKNNDNDSVVIIAYKAFYRGGKVILNWEHDEFLWVSKNEALQMDLTNDAYDIIKKWTPAEIIPEMSADYLLEFYFKLDSMNIKIWIDGGWGIDALLEKQTRKHDDLDIVIQSKDVEKTINYLKNLGYYRLEQDDATDWNFVMSDEIGHLIDFHVITFNENGDGIYGPEENGVSFPSNSFSEMGKINEKTVRCLTPEFQVKSHAGYKLRENDFHDIQLICDKFEIELPDEYKTSVLK